MAAIAPDRTVGIVVGSGAMGTGIAQVAASAGHRVRLYDTRPGAVDAAIANLSKTLESLVSKGRMAGERADQIRGRLEPAESLADLDVCALVVEAIAEDLEAKRRLFAELEGIVAEDCVLATNTSSLSISAIARGLSHPGRVAGFHFFNPAPVMALVEIVSGLTTSPEVAESLFATAEAWGKSPVHAASTPGFVVNRCARPFYAEALRLLTERAADAATIDAVMRDAGGFRMGPCELMDMIGHDVNFAVTNSVYDAYFKDPRYLPSVLQAEMVAAGRLGRKSGRGFFGYGAEAEKPYPATEPVGLRPKQVIVEGEIEFLEPLVARAKDVEIPIHRRPAGARGPTILVDGVALRLTDGRTATVRARETGETELVLHDLALDYAACTRMAIAVADQATGQAAAVATGFFQACGIAVALIDDAPGLVVMRTLAMLVNEALEAVQQGVVTAEGVDVAMTKGVNYPKGPFAWGREIGLPTVKTVLDNLHRHYGEDRYRASPRLVRLVARKVNADAIAAKAADAMWAQDRASQALGMEIVEALAGRAVLRMAVRREFCNGHGICHGGLIFTLADSAFAFACNSHNKVTVANNCAVTFVAAAREGDVLTARAVEVHRGGRSGVTEVEVRDQSGKLVALFRGHSTQIRGEIVPGLTPEEPKK